MTIFSSSIFAQMPRQSSRQMKIGSRVIFPIRKKPTRAQKRKLQPQSADLMRYAQFLSQPKTGIFRLFPDLGCEDNPNVIRADKKCLEAIPESSFYSFREKQHTANYLSDIRLQNNYLISDGLLAQGFLVVLGDVGLENVSLETEGISFMKTYSALTESAQVQKQFSQMRKGIKSGNFLYRKALPVSENMTYALRVVAYQGNIYQMFRGYRYDLLGGDKRIDLTVTFRIIGKTADGGITVLWKELDRRDAPKFQRVKKRL